MIFHPPAPPRMCLFRPFRASSSCPSRPTGYASTCGELPRFLDKGTKRLWIAGYCTWRDVELPPARTWWETGALARSAATFEKCFARSSLAFWDLWTRFLRVINRQQTRGSRVYSHETTHDVYPSYLGP